MGKNWTKLKYTKELLEPIVKSSKSFAQVIEKLGRKKTGGTQSLIKNKLDEFNIDYSHFSGQSWSKGLIKPPTFDYNGKGNHKGFLIDERGYKCEHCNRSEWNNQPIMLELDHIDGDNKNNKKTNLRLLCPNCHAQTPTWRRTKPSIATG